MAGNLTTEEALAILASDEAVTVDPFSILQVAANEITNNPESEQSLGLLLRMLEKDDVFGAYRPILNDLSRQSGLFPYILGHPGSTRDILAYVLHQPEGLSDSIVMHRIQAYVYRLLMQGESLVLSAPTSFGKSLIIDAIIASQKHANIAVIVPTLALADETRRRIADLDNGYKVITHSSQELAQRNVFVLTQERALGFENFPKVDFFVIDEFYKVGTKVSDDRTVSLNEVFYRFWKQGGQFYLLGPNVEEIPEGVTERFNCRFVSTDFQTVLVEQERVNAGDDDVGTLIDLLRTLDEPTLVFTKSPRRANDVARAMLEAGIGDYQRSLATAYAWIANNFHSDWVFGQALQQGIGLHHGKLPRALGHYVVRKFNEGALKYMVCTSTLIEGVNTKAKNVIIFDNKISNTKIDFFTFNNIRGRSGRMFQHFVGRVYHFHDPPDKDLPFVDFPFVTQSDDVPTSLLVQLDTPDLSSNSAKRLEPITKQEVLPMSLIRENHGLDPQYQVDAAEELMECSDETHSLLAWSGFPTYKQLEMVCTLIWRLFIRSNRRQAGVSSGPQLAFRLSQFSRADTTSRMVLNELSGGRYAASTVDEAVERVLDFARHWVGYTAPRYIMALSRIQNYVFSKQGRAVGDYSRYASACECYFQTPTVAALDEYGIPIQIAAVLRRVLRAEDNLDIALDSLKNFDTSKYKLDPFVADVISDAQKHL